jgi:hypothetical protein
MNWTTNGRSHFLYTQANDRKTREGLVYELDSGVFSVFRETHAGPYAREFLCMMPTLDEAKEFLQTIVGAQL